VAIQIVSYAAEHIPRVTAFNTRLRTGGVAYAFPESPVPAWLPPGEHPDLFQEYFLALDGDTVRGGYILKHQSFVVGDRTRSVGNFQLPLSEGTIDRRYAVVALQMLRDALRRQPLLYALGLGGTGESVTRLLQASRWTIQPVPFLFRVCRAKRFLRGTVYLRRSSARRLMLDLLAHSGMGAAGIGLWQRYRRQSPAGGAAISAESFAAFADWTDGIWQEAQPGFGFSAVRDRAALAWLYDRPDNRFLRLRLMEGDRACGWAVALATPLQGHTHFGDLKLGSIVDALSLPGCEAALMAAVTRHLASEQVDLIVTNQSFGPYEDAVRRCGYLDGPSNFLLATSPELTRLLAAAAVLRTGMHLTRGDGDGPIHL